MTTDTMTYTGTLVVVTCWCGIIHAIPKDLDHHASDSGASVYCPLGHAWVVGKSAQRKLEEERARTERLRNALTDEQQQHRRTERRLHATQGVVTRTRKRVGNGVCPCCGRTFEALARHMAAKHPSYQVATA